MLESIGALRNIPNFVVQFCILFSRNGSCFHIYIAKLLHVYELDYEFLFVNWNIIVFPRSLNIYVSLFSSGVGEFLA